MNTYRLVPDVPTIHEVMRVSMPNYFYIVQQEHFKQAPEKTLEGALAFLLRVIARIHADPAGERVGLLIKTAGENIVPYAGTFVSAGRLTFPDHDLLVKILTDIPSTNGPSWQPEEGIPKTGHHGGYLAVGADPGPVDPWPGDVSPAVLKAAFDELLVLFTEQGKRVQELQGRVTNLDVALQDSLIHIQWLERGETGPAYEGTGTTTGTTRFFGRDWTIPITVTVTSKPIVNLTPPDIVWVE